MSDEKAGTIHSSSAGGLAGKHPAKDQFQMLVGPSTADQYNTSRLGLIPIACWRVDDIRFRFGSSFVLPEVSAEMPLLAALIDDHTQEDTLMGNRRAPVISIFGHADPVGDDGFNKFLSGRRAAAIYGMLTRREDVWEDLYSNTGIFAEAVAGDTWGNVALQTMLSELVQPIAIDNEMGPETRAAIRRFQSENGLAEDGNPGPTTRKKMFRAYMDQLCVDSDGDAFQIDREAGFLARHQDSHGKGDFQGCGEFNPMLIFSQKDNAKFEQAADKTERNRANAPNRRVMALLFRPGSRIDPSKWPCPRAKEGVEGCRKRFWADNEKRRGARLPDGPRKYEQTQDTFACRFYDRISYGSPCERAKRTLTIRLVDAYRQPRRASAYVLRVGDQKFEGKTDSEGVLTEEIPAGATQGSLRVEPSLWEVELTIADLGPAMKVKGAQARLNNMGFFASRKAHGEMDEQTERALRRFQTAYDLRVNGQLDPATGERLEKAYGS